MMWVTVLASHPSDSIPTEITFCTFAPNSPSRPTVYTVLLTNSTRSFLESFLRGPLPFSSVLSSSFSRSIGSPAAFAISTSPPSSFASASSSTLESMCRIPFGSHNSSILILLCANAYSTRAAVCVMLATVIITGGVLKFPCCQTFAVSSQSLPRK